MRTLCCKKHWLQKRPPQHTPASQRTKKKPRWTASPHNDSLKCQVRAKAITASSTPWAHNRTACSVEARLAAQAQPTQAAKEAQHEKKAFSKEKTNDGMAVSKKGARARKETKPPEGAPYRARARKPIPTTPCCSGRPFAPSQIGRIPMETGAKHC